MANGKPTLRDVAAEAGVSPMTASNALHGKAGVRNRRGPKCWQQRKNSTIASI